MVALCVFIAVCVSVCVCAKAGRRADPWRRSTLHKDRLSATVQRQEKRSNRNRATGSTWAKYGFYFENQPTLF